MLGARNNALNIVFVFCLKGLYMIRWQTFEVEQMHQPDCSLLGQAKFPAENPATLTACIDDEDR